jgi:DNA-binding NarL/FixJ family response regulator
MTGAEKVTKVTVVLGRFVPVMARGLLDVLGDDCGVCVLASGVEVSELGCDFGWHASLVAIVGEADEGAIRARLAAGSSVTGAVVIARDPSVEYGMRLLAAGVSCMAWSLPSADMLAMVQRVGRGRRVFMSADGRCVERRYPSCAPDLTPREAEVLRHLSEGKSFAVIARELKIGIRTVHTYATGVYRKLDVRGKQELVGMPSPRVSKAA